MSTQSASTTTIDQLIDDFDFLETWEERYEQVIELGKAMAPLDPAHRTDQTKVSGCASQVWLVRELEPGTPPVLHFKGESDAMIVNGLIAVLLALYSGKTAKDILDTDAQAVFARLGLMDALSAQRANGLNSMVARIRSDAAQALEKADG